MRSQKYALPKNALPKYAAVSLHDSKGWEQQGVSKKSTT